MKLLRLPTLPKISSIIPLPVALLALLTAILVLVPTTLLFNKLDDRLDQIEARLVAPTPLPIAIQQASPSATAVAKPTPQIVKPAILNATSSGRVR